MGVMYHNGGSRALCAYNIFVRNDVSWRIWILRLISYLKKDCFMIVDTLESTLSSSFSRHFLCPSVHWVISEGGLAYYNFGSSTSRGAQLKTFLLSYVPLVQVSSFIFFCLPGSMYVIVRRQFWKKCMNRFSFEIFQMYNYFNKSLWYWFCFLNWIWIFCI